jgi:phosphatidylserine/phosphatidylglycerophosphate/cardiolipin synthase-like enzyme
MKEEFFMLTRSRTLALILSLALLLTPACNARLATDAPPPATVTPAAVTAEASPAELVLAPVELRIGYGAQSDWLGVYFTDPFSPYVNAREGGPDARLAAAIDSARQSVDVAIYSLNLWSIRDALLRAHKRGVTVRLVIDEKDAGEDAPRRLFAAGIPVVAGTGPGLMHNQFVFIDRREVWLGSANFTLGSLYYGNNHLVRIRSQEMAANYTSEFEEMFSEGFFGPDIIRNTPSPRLTINGVDFEVYFSPDDQPADRIVELLYGAQASIVFMAFSFTSDDISQALQDRFNADVTVRGVMETDQVRTNEGTEYDTLRQLGMIVRLDGNPGDMHHKVIIIDERIVITGSYNFSRSAEERNDENVLIIHTRRWRASFCRNLSACSSAPSRNLFSPGATNRVTADQKGEKK